MVDPHNPIDGTVNENRLNQILQAVERLENLSIGSSTYFARNLCTGSASRIKLTTESQLELTSLDQNWTNWAHNTTFLDGLCSLITYCFMWQLCTDLHSLRIRHPDTACQMIECIWNKMADSRFLQRASAMVMLLASRRMEYGEKWHSV